MKNLIVVLISVCFLMPNFVNALDYDMNGVTVNYDGNELTVYDNKNEVKIAEDSIYANGEEGIFGAENYEIDEDGSITMEGVGIDLNGNSDDEFVGLGDILIEEEGDVGSSLILKEIKENSILFDDNGKEVMVQVGTEGVKVSDNLGSVFAYYGESGIETSDIKIGEKSGTIYLMTDFGQTKVGALPLMLVRQVVNLGVKIEKVEFAWNNEEENLNYKISGIKTLRLLWIIPVSINEIHMMSVVDGSLVTIEKSVWHSFLDMISF